MDSTLAEHARLLLETNAYLTLGTVGPDGRPWTTPVYFAADGLTSTPGVALPNSQGLGRRVDPRTVR